MIIVRITGGLGNQLFKISQALRYKDRSRLVYLDTNFYLNDKFRRSFHFQDFDNINVISGWPRILIFKFKKFYEKIGIFRSFNEKESLRNKFSPLRVNYIMGNWEENQNPSDEILDKFRSFFKIKELDSKNENIVAVHFRRKDYDIKLGIEYYKKSIDKLININDKFKFRFFSDDHDFINNEAKKIFHNLDFEIYENKGVIEDFRELTTYKNYIMSNSTFSWWSIILNSEINENVIYPNEWEKNRDYQIYKFKSWEGV